MRELELKFLLDEASLARLRRHPALRALREGRPSTRLLRSIYFDTEDEALRKRRIALRLRKTGRSWTQTAKMSEEAIRGGRSHPREAENHAPGGRLDIEAIPDAEVRDAVRAAANGATLAPVFETRIRRSAHRLRPEGGGVVELALDKGEIVAGETAAPLIEAELELLEGEPGALYEVAEALFDRGPVRFSERSKAERGFLLAETGRAVDPVAPRTAVAPPLKGRQTTESAMRDVLLEALDQIAANAVAVVASDDPEGPHQLRVGLRRLRSAIKLFGGALGGPEAEALGETARRLGAEAGDLRDLDVLIEEGLAPVAAAEPEGAASLRAALETRRAACRAQVRRALASAETQSFLFELGRFVETRGWLRPADYAQTEALARPVSAAAAAALDKRWKKLARRAKHLERMSIEERHEMRKELKKLRYGVDFFAPIFKSRKVTPFLKRLKVLQDVFGALNDTATAEKMLTGPDAPLRDDPAAQRAVGRLLGWRAAGAETAWTRAVEGWRALEKKGPFWR